jgi:hypothetical protein
VLDQETREGIRQAAEGISAALSDKDKGATGRAAHRIIDSLRQEFGDDEAATKAAFMLCSAFAALRYTPVKHIDDMLCSSRDSYALAAGALAGVYTLPEREADENEPDAEPVPSAPVRHASDYLDPSAGPTPYL